MIAAGRILPVQPCPITRVQCGHCRRRCLGSDISTPNPQARASQCAYHGRSSLCPQSAGSPIHKPPLSHSPNTVGSLPTPHADQHFPLLHPTILSIQPHDMSSNLLHGREIPITARKRDKSAQPIPVSARTHWRPQTHPLVNTFSSDVFPHAPSPLQSLPVSRSPAHITS